MTDSERLNVIEVIAAAIRHLALKNTVGNAAQIERFAKAVRLLAQAPPHSWGEQLEREIYEAAGEAARIRDGRRV